ncbi:carboxypeptidase-like regulatory domain-containing protein [Pontibacter anaerobius]|uniref:Carboxypeptidase-like regulatory domain-containing protein n=1 Tax=Pontibacter anaerobius TaxID=2993940 RepID=A0ABT3RL82_9BACT|nr:carboxypeptidase-like regulatory domain-containing protein [Pontibacter anaerobius]MCX2741955.1 carboxypeptidase-like regulatory domain-containing protein [Pontibacter anaerobius]
MAKFLLLPLALLLSQCNGANQTHHDTQNDQMENQELPQQAQENKAQQAPIEQGIAGKVLWQAGNQMPSPDAPPSKGRGVERTLYVYELTNANQAKTTDGVFHTNIQTQLVTQVKSDADGNFAVSLKPGKYSLFSKEEKGLFASLYDGEMNINPVEVQEGQVTKVEFLINYQASY